MFNKTKKKIREINEEKHNLIALVSELNKKDFNISFSSKTQGVYLFPKNGSGHSCSIRKCHTTMDTDGKKKYLINVPLQEQHGYDNDGEHLCPCHKMQEVQYSMDPEQYEAFLHAVQDCNVINATMHTICVTLTNKKVLGNINVLVEKTKKEDDKLFHGIADAISTIFDPCYYGPAPITPEIVTKFCMEKYEIPVLDRILKRDAPSYSDTDINVIVETMKNKIISAIEKSIKN